MHVYAFLSIIIFQGEGINFSNLSKSAVYPLISGESAKAANTRVDEARYCVFKLNVLFNYSTHYCLIIR